ncbi:MAG: DEAD/DEAH box helicase, partial [Halobacteria archaeon]
AEALRAGLLASDRNLLLCMPTASGKTLLAEMAMAETLARGAGRCLYVVPLVALAAEKVREFRKAFPGSRVGISTGEYEAPLGRLADYDVLVLTAEKFDALTRSDRAGLAGTGLLVVDEAHLVADPSRGPRLEGALARFRIAHPRARLLALSATVGNPEGFAKWLGAGLVKSEWRPVPLRESVEVFRDDERLVEFLRALVAAGGQALVFVNTKKGSQALARKAARAFPPRPELKVVAERVGEEEIFGDLASMVERGVAYHNTWLHPSQRALLEEAFVERKLKVICCTPTLAMGVSFPARAAVVRDYMFFDPASGTRRPMPVFWVKQVFGRAGRPEHDAEGLAILVARRAGEKEALEEMYLRAEPEPVLSQFDPEQMKEQVLATVVAGAATREEVEAFFKATLYAHQGNRMNMARILADLEKEGFLSSRGDRWEPTPFGALVSRLYLSPDSGRRLKEGLAVVDCANDFDLCALVCAAREVPGIGPKGMDPYPVALNLGTEGAVGALPEGLGPALLLYSWIQEMGYPEFQERFGVYPGEVFSVVSSAEWLAHAAAELARHFRHPAARPLDSLRRRVEVGVREELLPLTAIRGVGRVYARRLFEAGFKEVADILEADEAELGRVFGIGPGRAAKLKEEVRRAGYGALLRGKRRGGGKIP